MMNQASRRQQPIQAPARLLPGPAIPGYQIDHHDGAHLFLINHLLVSCRATEYRVLKFLLQHYQQQITWEELIALFEDSSLEMVDLLERAKRKLVKLISDLRRKIWECGLVIVCLSGVGYMLISRAGYTPLTTQEGGYDRFSSFDRS